MRKFFTDYHPTDIYTDEGQLSPPKNVLDDFKLLNCDRLARMDEQHVVCPVVALEGLLGLT